LCLNCCGLNLRLNYPEFGELICQHDFICLQETKTDDTDQINLKSFSVNTEKSLSSAVLALKSPAKDIYLYDLENFLISKSASAVDYFICSPNFIKCIDDLTVLDFSKCFSDVHTPLSIIFESNVFEDSDSDINALDNTERFISNFPNLFFPLSIFFLFSGKFESVKKDI
jgi:hypothetical protein